MKTKIRDVDFARVLAQAEAHYEATGEACHPDIEAELSRKRTTPAMLAMLRDFTALAAVFDATSADDIRADSPLMRALSAVQQRLRGPITRLPLRDGTDVAERVNSLAQQRLTTWDPDRFIADVIEAIKQNGDGEVDEAQVPWRNDWGRATPAVLVLFLFAALRKADVFVAYPAETDEERREREPRMRGDAPPTPAPDDAPRGKIDRNSLRDHEEWTRRSREGSGRLDVVGVDASGIDLHGSRLAAARFVRVNLRKAKVAYANLADAELAHCNLETAGMTSTHFENARITDCNFTATLGDMVKFDRATIAGSRFERAILDRSQWSDATVTATSFERAGIGNARFDRAKFVDCDFRGAYFGASTENPAPSMHGAVFVNCDFRDANFTRAKLDGVTFERCKFAGARGEPTSSVDLAVTDADVGGPDQLLVALEESLTIEQILENPGPLVAARDSADPLRTAVFIVGEAARLLTRVPLTNALAGLRKGATYGRSGVLWAWDHDTLTIWNAEHKVLEVGPDSAWWPAGPFDRKLVTRVVSYINPERLGNRGVLLELPGYKFPRFSIIQDNDFAADRNSAYTRDDAKRDGAWASHLGRHLAEWLGVPHDDEFAR